jgi:hypothetical protein
MSRPQRLKPHGLGAAYGTSRTRALPVRGFALRLAVRALPVRALALRLAARALPVRALALRPCRSCLPVRAPRFAPCRSCPSRIVAGGYLLRARPTLPQNAREGWGNRISSDHWRWLLRTRQNELSPNQAKMTAQPRAMPRRPNPTCPAWYFPYSLKLAPAKLTAMSRKMTPVTSSQSWCRTRPKERAVVRAAPKRAETVRLRPACWPAMRAATPNFRKVETLLTASILTGGGDTMTRMTWPGDRLGAGCI